MSRAPRSRRGLLAAALGADLRLLFEEQSAGRVLADAEGRVLRTNAQMQRMLGGALDPVPGTPLTLLFAGPERDAVWAEIDAVLHGAAARPITAQLAGTTAPTVSLACTALPAGAGVLVVAHDISLQSRLEAQVAQSQRLQAVGQLAGGIAHDFNNLLTAIAHGAEAIAARHRADEETQEDIEAIRASTERGAGLVRHLLAFGRQQTFQPRVLALDEVVARLARVLRRLLGSRVRLELALESQGRLVRVDPTALDQVVVNLAVNARDAMPSGGVLTLRTGQLRLHRPLPRGAETIPPGSYAMLEVQDVGSGIAPEVLPHIFEPFFTTRRDSGGTGLGLSTVHGIIRQSDGFLGVESEPGRGTRMRVYLPAWQGAPEPAASPAPASPTQPSLPFPESPPPVRRAVLLVDDEDVVRRVAERALARRGWHVLAAPTAEAALHLLEPQPPPALVAVVSDLVMPGMDGAALVQAVRARLGRPQLPAVLVSGYADEELRERIAMPGEAGMRFLAKPYDIAALTDVLAELVPS